MKDSYHCFGDRRHPHNYRQEEIQALRRAIRAKENRLVVGIPDIGLSNLLRFLVARTDWGERNVTFAYLDCDALKDCLDIDMFFTEIARQFFDQRLGGGVSENVEGFERLKRIVAEASGASLDRLVVVANKTDKMLEKADAAFYHKLKALTDYNIYLCYIFASGPSTENVVDPEGLLFAGRKLIVRPFNKRDLTRAIAEEGQRLEMEFGPAAREQLAYLTGGHPGLLRSVGSAVVEEELDLSGPEADLVERLVARGDVKSRCQRIWGALDPAQRSALRTIASNQLHPGAKDTLARLRDLGLVCKHNGEYQLFSPLFSTFVAAQHISAPPLQPVRIEGATTISVNGQDIIVAGKVLKGNKEVHVASLEFRLIACLKREPRIYTKDEIASYVYYEEQGAVEDSRIEDLVRRVRQRLGSSQYIKTHWGRGYEFLA